MILVDGPEGLARVPSGAWHEHLQDFIDETTYRWLRP